MDIDKLCMGCMTLKESAHVCSYCDYNEKEDLGPLILPPRTLLLNGHFLIGRVLGKPGGFGITYLAWDVKLETQVAIKEFLPRDLAGRGSDRSTVIPHHSDDRELFAYGLERFVSEARTLAKFDHPNVVRVRTFFEENDTAYLVMSYYEGIPLSRYLEDKGGRIEEKLAADIIMPVMDGIRSVHDKGFLHRDIKPQNIYLTVDGVPILLDFGAARLAMGERSRSLSVVITAGYAPFEQYHKKGKQGPWTDIYSTAATLYKMVTSETPPEATDRIMEDELVSPRELVPQMSERLEQALVAALSIKPENRPQSIKEFQEIFWDQEEQTTEASSECEDIDEAVFNFAQLLDTPEAFDLFLNQFPDSPYIQQARIRIMELERENTKNKTPQGNTQQDKDENQEKEKQDSIKETTVQAPESKQEIPPAPEPSGEPLNTEYRSEDGKLIVIEGALKRQGSENVLVWEDDAFIKEKFPKAVRNDKGFWEMNTGRDVAMDIPLIYIPAGEFIMGNDGPQAYDDEGPVHKVYLDGYWIGKYEVTFDQFDAYCYQTKQYKVKGILSSKNKPSDAQWGRGKRPVINVSWHDADAYCKWLTKQMVLTFSLPTEAQWEKAARGTDGRKYCWGNQLPTPNHANFQGESEVRNTPVDHYPAGASPYGVMDLCGNVDEWCKDWQKKDYYKISPAKNPQGFQTGRYRIIRGGRCCDQPQLIHCAYRQDSNPSTRSDYTGFRLTAY